VPSGARPRPGARTEAPRRPGAPVRGGARPRPGARRRRTAPGSALSPAATQLPRCPPRLAILQRLKDTWRISCATHNVKVGWMVRIYSASSHDSNRSPWGRARSWKMKSTEVH